MQHSDTENFFSGPPPPENARLSVLSHYTPSTTKSRKRTPERKHPQARVSHKTEKADNHEVSRRKHVKSKERRSPSKSKVRRSPSKSKERRSPSKSKVKRESPVKQSAPTAAAGYRLPRKSGGATSSIVTSKKATSGSTQVYRAFIACMVYPIYGHLLSRSVDLYKEQAWLARAAFSNGGELSLAAEVRIVTSKKAASGST